jgi:hypothetical protein
MRSRTRLEGLLALCVVASVAATVPTADAVAPACTISWVGGVAAAPTAWFGFDPHTNTTNADDQYNWNQQRFPSSTDDVCFPAGSVATTDQVDQNTPDVRSITISEGATFSVTDVQVIVREDSSNAGTLNMVGPVPLNVSDGDPADHETLTNTATGIIHFTAGGPAGLRAITGDLVNQGLIDVDHPQASIQAASPAAPAVGNQTNQGTIDISAGNALRSISSNFVNSTGGNITGAGSMNMDGARFEAAGNSVIDNATDVTITNGVIAGAAGSAATGRLHVVGPFAGQGPSVLEGTVPAGITLDVDRATLQAPAVTTTVNAGRINLKGNAAQLQVLPNSTGTDSTSKLTNTGTIELTADAPSGFRFITGNLDNQGTILVNDPQASFQTPGGTNTPPTLTNTGTITVSGGNTLRAIQQAVIVNGSGGVINGAGAVNHGDSGRLEIAGNSQISAVDYNLGGGSDLSFSAGSTAIGNVDINGSGFDPCTLSGNVPAGFSLDVQNAFLRSLTSFTNAGTITLHRAAGDSFEAWLQTEDASAATTETLTNTGTLAFTGTAGSTHVSGDVLNQGTILASGSNTLLESETEARPPKLTNASGGTLTVAADSQLSLVPDQASFVENAGTVVLNGVLAPGAIGYTQTAGTTTLATSASSIGLSTGGAVTLQGGTLRGMGIVTGGDVNNTGGTVAPGTSPGVLTFGSSYSQGPSGTLAVEVSGAAPGTGHDQLVVGGAASLGGTLAVTTSGFSPATGQQFRIIDAPAPPTAPTVTGTFATVQQSGGRTYSLAVNPTDVTLTALAPPSPPPPPDTSACDAAKAKLAAAKKKLKKLKKHGAAAKKIKRAKQKVKKRKQAVNQACTG